MIVLIVIYSVYCVSISVYLNRTINRYRMIHKIHPTQLSDQFNFQTRPDNPLNWSKPQMILIGILILPIRMVVFILSVMGCILSQVIVNLLPNGSMKQSVLRMTMYINCRLMMLSIGYHWIHFNIEHPSQYLDQYPKQTQNHEFMSLPLIISNHVAFTDIFMIVIKYCPSFLAKSELSKVWMFNNAAKAMNSLWVHRTDRNSKDILLRKIDDRINDYNSQIDCESNNKVHQCRSMGPLLIFPEGTTSNGHQLLSFKQGAFINRSSMRVLCIDYTQQSYMNFLDNEGQLVNLIMLMSQIHNTVTITEFQFNPSYLYTDTQTHHDWKLYADQVKLLIQNKLNIGSTEAGFMDVKVYSKLYESLFTISVDQAVQQVNQDNLKRQQKHEQTQNDKNKYE